MAGTPTSVFGKPVTSSIADEVLRSPSMTATPSPSQPEHVPSGTLAKRYGQLYAIAQSALNEEQDDRKRAELERIVAFADSALSDSIQTTGSAGAPVPDIPPIPAPQAPPQPAMAGASGGMQPQAAPMGAAPAVPSAPPPGAAQVG